MRKCPQGKIINPKTGRCVKKDGKIGKEIVRKSPKSTRKSRKSTRKTTKSRKVRSDKGKKRGTRVSRKSPKTTRKSRKVRSDKGKKRGTRVSRKSPKTTRKSPKTTPKSPKTTRKSPKTTRKSPKTTPKLPKTTPKTTTLNNMIDEKFVSSINKKIFKVLLYELSNGGFGPKFTITTDAKKSIIQIVFAFILKTINIANQKCNNCVISETDIMSAIKSLLDTAYTGMNGLLDHSILSIRKTIMKTIGLNKIKDLQKIKDLEAIDILSQFVENNSKHKVDISALIIITIFTTYLFAEVIDIAMISIKPITSRISTFDVIYTMFHDDEFNELIKKHKILSTPVYNKLRSKFDEHKNLDWVKIRKKLLSQITYETLF